MPLWLRVSRAWEVLHAIDVAINVAGTEWRRSERIRIRRSIRQIDPQNSPCALTDKWS